jgi:outer membrane lipoprotein-sorting protein
MTHAKKSERPWNGIFGLALAITLAISGWAGAAEFSAQMVTRGPDVGETQGKVYVKGDKFRQEFGAGEETHISILRPDKQVVWMLMPAGKMYMEMPITPEHTGKMMPKPKDEARMKLLGIETVSGYEAEKYEVSGKDDAGSKQYVWVVKKLGIPIKMTMADGSFSMEYRNIKEGGVSDSLFEVPGGYQKMAMPGGMPMR